MSKVIAIHDLSLWSKSSLSLVHPVLEAMGHETFLLPTMILSTQSDGYPHLEKIDLSSSVYSYYRCIKDYGYSFDAVYSGYLGNVDTAKAVGMIAEEENTFTLVDPVLGDNGELYQDLKAENVDSIRSLTSHANVITPNITEASILTESSMLERYTNAEISSLIGKLKRIGPGRGVITSVPLSIGQLANVAYDEDEIRLFSFEDLGVSYPGSGDLFASLFLSMYLAGYSFFTSVKLSGEITSRAVRYAKESKRERRMGISLVPVMEDVRKIL